MRRIQVLLLMCAGATFANEELTVELPGGETMDMVWILPGTFTMGAPHTEKKRGDHELPQHEVTISRGLYLGKFEITQGQWEAVMGSTPWSGEDFVVESPEHPDGGSRRGGVSAAD